MISVQEDVVGLLIITNQRTDNKLIPPLNRATIKDTKKRRSRLLSMGRLLSAYGMLQEDNCP